MLAFFNIHLLIDLMFNSACKADFYLPLHYKNDD